MEAAVEAAVEAVVEAVHHPLVVTPEAAPGAVGAVGAVVRRGRLRQRA